MGCVQEGMQLDLQWDGPGEVIRMDRRRVATLKSRGPDQTSFDTQLGLQQVGNCFCWTPSAQKPRHAWQLSALEQVAPDCQHFAKGKCA